MTISDQKQALRKGLIQGRPTNQPTLDAFAVMKAALLGLLPDETFQLAAYLPIRRELDPLPLVEALNAFPVALPRTPVEPGPLDFRLWSPGDPLDTGLFNTKEPPITAPKLESKSVVVLLPLVGFDRSLYRLGYGGGFYDRTLELFRNQGKQVLPIGLAYDSQLVEGQLPVEPTDERLAAVITPTQVFLPGQEG